MHSTIAVASQEAKALSVPIDAFKNSDFTLVALWSATGLLASIGLLAFSPLSSDVFALMGAIA